VAQCSTAGGVRKRIQSKHRKDGGKNKEKNQDGGNKGEAKHPGWQEGGKG